MALIPSSDTLQSLTTQGAIAKAPAITVFGCGGCGTNLVYAARDVLKSVAQLRYLDTSDANILDKQVEKSQFTMIGKGLGSGGHRAENLETVLRVMPDIDETLFEGIDIAVLVMSGAGGTGSVVGPAMLREIHKRARAAKRKTRVVILMVADVDSHTAAKNTEGTLKTLLSFSQSDKLYVPMMVISNEVGRQRADITAIRRLCDIALLLGLPTLEVDFNDRMNFLDSTALTGVAPGLRLIHVVSGIAGVGADNLKTWDPDEDPRSGEVWAEAEHKVADSVLTLGIRDQAGMPQYLAEKVRARTRYTGAFATTQLKPMLGVVAVDDSAITELMANIANIKGKFESQTKAPVSAVELNSSEVSDGGWVL